MNRVLLKLVSSFVSPLETYYKVNWELLVDIVPSKPNPPRVANPGLIAEVL